MPLKCGTNNRLLRQELDKITDLYSGDRVAEQIRAIRDLAPKYHHSISLVQEMIPTGPENLRSNCYRHAFSLLDVRSVDEIIEEHPYITPGRDFARFLIDSRLEDREIQDTTNGDLIVYCSGDEIEHVGKLSLAAIESKWGKAHVWNHGIYEVPLRYGDTVRFFQRISQDVAAQAFLEYARTRGANL